MDFNRMIVNGEPDTDFQAITSTSTKEITWNVRDIESMPEDDDYSTDSPPFVFQDAIWCLRLYPNNESDEYMGLMVVRLSSRVPRHTLRCCLFSRKVRCIHCETINFNEYFTEGGTKKWLYRSDMHETSYYHRMKCLDVICIISDSESCAVDAFPQTAIQDAKDVRVFGQNGKDLLQNGQDHDIVLKVKDKEFRAHQNILRARSPILDSMLSHDMIEKNSGVIDIPDCDPIAFEQFLIYLYSGRVDNLDEGNMLPLYCVADKYDAGDLKEECRKFIKKSLTTGNITDVVQVALDHSDADLLRRSTEYFVKRMELILPTVEWVSFMKRNPVQANELFIKATKNIFGLMGMPLRGMFHRP